MTEAKSILERFEEIQRTNQRASEKAEAEAAAKAKEHERRLRDLRGELERERGILGGMMADYSLIEGELQKAASAEIEAKAATAERVKTGEVSIGEYLKAGLKAGAIRKQAADDTTAKLADVAKLIREKRREIYRLELEAAEVEFSLAYLTQASPNLRLEKLRLELTDFERILTPIADAYAAAGLARNEAEKNYQIAKGFPHPHNLLWDELSFTQIRALALDPRIPESMLPEIDNFLLGADPAGRFSGKLVFSIGNFPTCITFWDIGGPRVVGPGMITTESQ